MTALTFAPSRGQAGLQLLAGVVLAALVVPAPPLGRVLLVPAALAMLALAVRDLVLVPTLSAYTDGLTVAGRSYPWSEVARLRVVTDRRSPLLEVDLEHTVVVLSRRRLGTAPYLALEQLEELLLRRG